MNRLASLTGAPVFRGRALTGDPRNDMGDDLFKEALRLTRWHYR
jgi:hypothetical protein